MSKNLLISGGAGFVGSHLVQYFLQTTDYNIIILDRLDYAASLQRIEPSDRVRLVWWDLKAEFNKSIRSQLKNIDLVIHASASSHVDRSVADPMGFFQDNVIGTINLYNWARNINTIEKIIHVSTDEVFGSTKYCQIGYKEEDPTHPENPYAASKAAAESVCFSYAATYRLPISIIRMTNIIGIKQHPEKFIPLVIRKILKNELIEVHSNDTATLAGTRYYLDVVDMCRAFGILINSKIDLLTKDNAYAGVNHISGDNGIGNNYIVTKIGSILNIKPNYKLIAYSSNRPYHDLNYQLDDTRFRRLYAWSPKIDLDYSLRRIVQWYQNNPSWLDL